MTKIALHLIGGPTASGKSAFALELAQKLGGIIINADAMQMYGGLPILTAQPSDKAQAECPHLLYAAADPLKPFSVGRWLEAAEQALNQALTLGKTPVFVGGTGLYFKALTTGLAEIPAISPEIRAQSQALYDSLGHDAFRAKLARLDPVSAERLMPNDRQRLVRAYEVALGTGNPLDYWHKQSAPKALAADFDVTHHLIMPERDTLYAACDKRFDWMMANGAMDEVRALVTRASDLPPTVSLDDLPAMKILGVPELAAYLRGAMTLETAVEKAKQYTRNYAKRQVTWFKNQWDA